MRIYVEVILRGEIDIPEDFTDDEIEDDPIRFEEAILDTVPGAIDSLEIFIEDAYAV